MKKGEYLQFVEVSKASNAVSHYIELQLIDMRINTREDFNILSMALVEVREVLDSVEVNVTLVLVVIKASQDGSPIVEFISEDLELSNCLSDWNLDMAVVIQVVLVDVRYKLILLLVDEVN